MIIPTSVKMCFSDAGRAQKDDVFLARDKGEAEQLHDLFFVQLQVKGDGMEASLLPDGEMTEKGEIN